MKVKFSIILLVVLLLAASAGYFYLRGLSKGPAPVVENSSPKTPESRTGETSPVTTPPEAKPTNTNNSEDVPLAGRFSAEEDVEGSPVAVFRVNFDGESFVPKETTISVGDIIWFENSSSVGVWPKATPASGLPEFDAKKAILKGGRFTHTFTKKGSFEFVDSLGGKAHGKIIVK